MAEGVQPALRIECRTVGSGEDDTGGTDGGAHGTWNYDAHTRGSGGLVAGPGYDRRTGFETGRFGPCFGDFPTHVR